MRRSPALYFFFFNDTATTEIYTLSLHDALPICAVGLPGLQLVEERARLLRPFGVRITVDDDLEELDRELAPVLLALVVGARALVRLLRRRVVLLLRDRKSTRLNSSHQIISYAVF